MAIRLRDRVKQGTVSTGTGTISLSTSFSTFQDFGNVLSDGDSTYYTIENTTDFEVGQGTYSGNTLSRDQVFSSSNSNALVSLAGSSTVFITYPASKSVHFNGSGNVTGIESLDFKLGVTPQYEEGRVFYDSASHALAVYNDEADITLQVGQEQYMRVRNSTGSTISNGQAVILLGSQGTNPTIKLGIATSFESSNVIGIATHDIENNSFGYVTTFGLVNDVATSDFAEGSELYLSPTVSGGLTGVAPSAPFYQSPIGICVRQHPSVGTVLVQPRATKLGGFDVKNLGDIQQSGIAFVSDISEASGAILSTNTGFYYSVSTDTLNVANLDVAENINTNSVVVEDGGSYKIYSLGQEGDADTEYLEISHDGTDFFINSLSTGTGTAQSVALGRTNAASMKHNGTGGSSSRSIVPQITNTYVIGSNGLRYNYGYFNNGDFNGLLNASGISVDVGGSFNMYSLGADGDADIESLSVDYDAPNSRWLISSNDPTGTGLARQLWFDASQVRMYESNTLLWLGENNQLRMYGDIVPSSDGLKNLGISSRKFLSVNAINGDFSGTLTTDFMQSNSGSFSDDLVSETGANHRFYRLGAEGDANVEYVNMGWNGETFVIGTQEAGTGVGQDIRVNAGLTRMDLTNDGNITLVRNNATYMILGSANITVYRYFRPNSDLGVDFGSADRRWGEGYFGHLQSDTITLSGLQYSDPLNSGQIWQSGQYLRISHG